MLTRRTRTVLSTLALAAVAGAAAAIAQPAKDSKPATPAATPAQPAGAPPEMQLPPGWTMEDMQACMEAGTPGEMHAHLAKAVGVWHGKTKMWMAPGGPVMESECTATITSIMDGRYTRCEIEGDMPGMGPFNGFGVYGFDNVSQKFQSTWIDNHSTGIMIGTGELSADGKTMTWSFTYNCPLTKKPAKMREVERRTGPDAMTMEMFGTDPKTGNEYKMMEIAYTRKAPGATTKAPATKSN